MATLPIEVNGAGLLAHVSGVLYWPERAMLIVADLHLEKGSSYGRSRQFLPPYDTQATLAALARVVEAFHPRRIVCLGDSFHDREAAARLAPDDRSRLAALAAGRDWVWLLGNHDPSPPEDVPGDVAEELVEGPLVLRHEAIAERPDGELSGHFHPKAAIRTRARRVAARCFISDGRRLILPSFGAYTGGLCVTNPAIANLFGRGAHVLVLGGEKLHRFPVSALTPIRA